ncbi:arylsulfatase [uncultured Paludibaculum sp.]|uniref:sulfatase family protein n=1 Tax=uncultured Paludibaculum sp. TaxID=1765020 RepID=UPI002AAB9E42|nr:arylsulfatase [uncultured Paludibaculum sp.]
MTLTRRSFCSTLALGAHTGVSQAAVERPNIVLILADDLGNGDLSCYNPRSGIATRNLDRLAEEGVRFTDMHSPSSVCTPTRYGLLTGRYCWRSRLKRGVLQGDSPNLIEEARLTLPSLLRERGYYTAGVGKWHLGLGDRPHTDFDQPLSPGPRAHGFDYYFGIPASLDMAPYLYFENDRVVERATERTPGSGGTNPRGAFWRAGAIAPHFDIGEVMPTITRKAVSVVKERAVKKAPFFLYFPMTGPHTPWMPRAPFQGKSTAGEYGDFVAQIDDSVRQVLAAIEESGIRKNTLVLFASDNGAYWTADEIARYGHRANNGWRGMKADIFDGGHRVPFLARWPGRVKAGRTCGDLSCLTDVVATAADLSGVELPKAAAEDSFSLLPAMMAGRAGRGPRRTSVIHHSAQGMFSVREGQWKLIAGRGSGGFTKPVSVTPGPGEAPGELYDMTRDPAETGNLYLKEAEVVERLTGLLEKAKAEGRTRPA